MDHKGMDHIVNVWDCVSECLITKLIVPSIFYGLWLENSAWWIRQLQNSAKSNQVWIMSLIACFILTVSDLNLWVCRTYQSSCDEISLICSTQNRYVNIGFSLVLGANVFWMWWSNDFHGILSNTLNYFWITSQQNWQEIFRKFVSFEASKTSLGYWCLYLWNQSSFLSL